MGLAVGSFASVSLDPPLVALLPGQELVAAGRRSRPPGAFCVNILAEDQEEVCRRFASKGDDKFAGLGWAPAGSGSPLLDGVLAWIDCDIESVTEAGDHFCVMGRVRDLAVVHDGAPLVFFRGGYGRFAV